MVTEVGTIVSTNLGAISYHVVCVDWENVMIGSTTTLPEITQILEDLNGEITTLCMKRWVAVRFVDYDNAFLFLMMYK